MKRVIKLCGLIPLICIAIVMCTSSCGSVSGGKSKYSYADSVAHNVARMQMTNRQFVLTASRITIGNSPTMNVTDNTNFVLVNGEDGIIQLSPRIGGGFNGVGGFTTSGKVQDYKVKESNNGDLLVTFRLMATIGSAEVRINLFKGYNGAQALVDATFSRGKATLNGEIKALNANYIEGMSF